MAVTSRTKFDIKFVLRGPSIHTISFTDAPHKTCNNTIDQSYTKRHDTTNNILVKAFGSIVALLRRIGLPLSSSCLPTFFYAARYKLTMVQVVGNSDGARWSIVLKKKKLRKEQTLYLHWRGYWVVCEYAFYTWVKRVNFAKQNSSAGGSVTNSNSITADHNTILVASK